jgi:hypothetical protein
MEDKKYYAIFDNQNNAITSIALNKRKLTQVKKCLITYLLDGSFSEEGEDYIRNNSLEELLNYYEFSLLEGEKPFEN